MTTGSGCCHNLGLETAQGEPRERLEGLWSTAGDETTECEVLASTAPRRITHLSSDAARVMPRGWSNQGASACQRGACRSGESVIFPPDSTGLGGQSTAFVLGSALKE